MKSASSPKQTCSRLPDKDCHESLLTDGVHTEPRVQTMPSCSLAKSPARFPRKIESDAFSLRMCRSLPYGIVFSSLIAVRLLSAAVNIIHDCDEVYNYWEPLHRLLYGFGKQPWEYSPQYALRSYFYILLHWLFAAPIAWMLGDSDKKIFVFYALRSMFAVISSSLESRLHRCVSSIFPGMSSVFFVALLFNAGLSMASTTFLPSSFAMHCMTAATVALLNRSTRGVIWWSVVGVLIGWPVCGISFLPYAVYVLAQPLLLQSFAFLFLSFGSLIVPLVLSDIYFYGKWTVSLWNFVKYNVIGGGQSALYGVEEVTYYLRNGFLNFNIMFLFSCLLPVIGTVYLSLMKPRKQKIDDKETVASITDYDIRRLLLICSPVYIWLVALSMLPHKEERFLYIVYPQICLSGSLCLSLISDWILKLPFPKVFARSLKQSAVTAILLVYIGFSVMRIAAVWINLGDPASVYKSLPATKSVDKFYVCAGDEWHRFPSSFSLPSPSYRLGFLEQDFNGKLNSCVDACVDEYAVVYAGLLPADFSEERMGTRVVSKNFNDKNEPNPENYMSVTVCRYVIDFETVGERSLAERYDPDRKWTVLENVDILDRRHSPPMTRMFYVPFLNKLSNSFGRYVLYRTNNGS